MEHQSLFLCGILLWCCISEYSSGLVTLSPSGAAQVCIGQQLEVTCTTNETALIWNFLPPLINDRGVSVRLDWFIASTDLTQQLQQIRVNSTTFTFVRISMRHISPLVSTMTIINSSNALNMTEIKCTEIVGNERGTAASSTIQVIGDVDHQRGNSFLDMNISTTPQFGDGDLSIIIEWIPEEGVTYEIMSVPETAVTFLKQSRIRVTLFYNIHYNISIEAVPCRQNIERVTTTVSLHYATCEHPFLNQKSNNSNSPVVGHSDPMVEGRSITISCPPGLVLIGPSTLVCMGNGKWEPDPRVIACTEPTTSTESITGSTSSSNVQTDNAVTAAVVIPLVSVFLVILVIVFFIGFICGCCFGQKSRPKSSIKTETPVALYENVLPSAAQHDRGQHDPLEFNENVAYGFSQT